ncbi:MAG: DNA primase [Waddliaceae bacterium]|nr:DNA primase [Waddliaceae bacterium]
MSFFTKESLELLRQRVELPEFISSFIEMQRTGAAYKALCPFHDEKTPSFSIQRGDKHYHCFGCGAHGDAIQFLMDFQRLSFSEAVEFLAERFHVPLERMEEPQDRSGPNKKSLFDALDAASRFFHFNLMESEEGREALNYLYARGITKEFIQNFQLGLAPAAPGIFQQYLRANKVNTEVMLAAGLVTERQGQGLRDFFIDRITIPVLDVAGRVIGFTARKYKESTYGGKYINTSETLLFKKSRVLFGLNYCRRRITKEKRAIIVEGQLDALKMIEAGFTITVAAQGTAFGEGHVQELLKLGVEQVYLAFDSDQAGREAASKVGDMFQTKGVEVLCLRIPVGADPDSLLRDAGAEAVLGLMKEAVDYLTFVLAHRSHAANTDSPAIKTQIVQKISEQVRAWEDPVMVHESLRKLAQLTDLPESLIGVEQPYSQTTVVRKSAVAGSAEVDGDMILEADFLRWLLFMGQLESELLEIAKNNLRPEQLKNPVAAKVYAEYLERERSSQPKNIVDLMDFFEGESGQLFFEELSKKKINRDRAQEFLVGTIQKILERNWMEKRESIKQKIQSGQCSDDEAMALLKEFDRIRKEVPRVLYSQSV